VKFLELPGVGSTMADGTDEDGAHAARMDGRIAWETIRMVDSNGHRKMCICVCTKSSSKCGDLSNMVMGG
jgi:hypothetical protein